MGNSPRASSLIQPLKSRLLLLYVGGHKSIHEESNESAQNRVLRLEKENRHLQSLVNSYKVSMSSAQLEEVSETLNLCSIR